MRRKHIEEMEKVGYKNTICKYCQNRDSCSMVKNDTIFCTGFKKGRTPIELLVDFYECDKGHRFGVDNVSDVFRKDSILCPVCRCPAFFREVMKIQPRQINLHPKH
ncbi:MAG: hypothetical protein H3Z52_03025 [archaeon]|nr:hypothetical protein [archaeon]